MYIKLWNIKGLIPWQVLWFLDPRCSIFVTGLLLLCERVCVSFGARVNVLHVSVPGRVWRQEERDARRQQQLVEIHSVKRARRYTEREDNRGCLLGRLRGRGGQWSITNRIHLSAWLIFPIKTAQQGPQQSTSWNRGYFSACLSPGCACVCVCVTCIYSGIWICGLGKHKDLP